MEKEETILIIRPESEAFRVVLSGLRLELDSEFRLIDRTIGPDFKLFQFTNLLDTFKPQLLILMDVRSLNLYRRYQESAENKKFPPAIILMTVHLENQIGSLINATGITYEVPGVTVLRNLRSLFERPIQKVGVIYRRHMSEFIDENRELLRSEEFTLVGYPIDAEKSAYSEIRKGLKTLINKETVDAIWVLNDSIILESRLLSSAWLPKVKRSKVPVVTGVERLIQSEVPLGTFAVVPDHYGLGIQAAELVWEIVENNWSAEGISLSKPVSVHKIFNAKLAEERRQEYRQDVLLELDKIIQ